MAIERAREVAIALAVTVLVSAGLSGGHAIRAQLTQRGDSNASVPDEAAGIDGVVRSLISVYDHFDVVALGEMHDRHVDSDLRIALVRHPDFAKRVRTIVVEWGSTREQATLDRYIRGEEVSAGQYAQVWKTLSPGNIGDLVSERSIYTDFFAAVRAVNATLPAADRMRVFGGDPGPAGNRDAAAVSILQEQALQKHGKALVIYGHAHFWRAGGTGMVTMLDRSYPGRTFAVIPVGGPRERPTSPMPDYQKFDSILTTQVRPVMVPLHRLPFSSLMAADFLSGDVVMLRGGRWVSLFAGSTRTLAEIADACVYFGRPDPRRPRGK
jgi:hypothetical protein